MTGPLYAIGRFCSRHHYPVIAVWVVLAIALVAISNSAGSKTSENLTLPGTDSTIATELLEDDLPEQAYGSNPLVFEAPQGKLSQAKYATGVEETVKRLNELGEVNSAVSPLSPRGAAFLSEDGSIGYTPVVLNVGPGEIDEEQAQRILNAAAPARAAGLETAVGSYVGQQLSKPDTEVSEAIGLAAAVIILLFAFGTATAMMLPIVSAVLGLACALSIIRLLEHVLEVPGVASTLATMIGLGVGIDYALFIVTRHKLQLGEGMEVRESIARATATAGGAVVFAGFTVVIALCSLAFAGIPLVSTLGFTAAVAVVVAVSAATTLLPAMLGALGPRINSLKVKLGKTHPDDKEPHGWRRWAERVSARPGTATVGLAAGPDRAGAACSAAGSRPERHQRPAQGHDLAAGLRRAQRRLRGGCQRSAAGRLRIQLAGGSETGAAGPAERSQRRGRRRSGRRTDAGQSRTRSPSSPCSRNPSPGRTTPSTWSKTCGKRSIPQALKGTEANSYVGGQTAGYIDLASQIADKLPLMIAIVVALSFFVLLVAFRSLLVPVKAAAMNLLSVAAAYGIVTAVFQLGWGSSLIGLDHAIPIVSFVPLLMFAILFGLSMDYEVFLLTQMQRTLREVPATRSGRWSKGSPTPAG